MIINKDMALVTWHCAMTRKHIEEVLISGDYYYFEGQTPANDNRRLSLEEKFSNIIDDLIDIQEMIEIRVENLEEILGE